MAEIALQVTAERPYPVLVGNELTRRLPELLGPDVAQVALLHSPTLTRPAAELGSVLEEAGYRVADLVVPDGEAAKTAAVAAGCWEELGRKTFTRSDAVLGFGGGSTTDLAGFVAATWLRGVRLVQVPTTLLGMVDAAVGGKTGINTAQGKNLVGSFYEPAGVVCDLDRLRTLPGADLRAGLAEVVKCGFVADPQILTIVEESPASVVDPKSAELRELVQRAVTVKADVVSADLRERTSAGTAVGREALNYGHTLGHAVERREDYRWRHGEAISVGMVFAAELARRAGRLDDATADRHRDLLRSLALPVRYDPDAFAELLALMALDKKARGAVLRFVVLDGLARPAILTGPDPEVLRSAYAALR